MEYGVCPHCGRNDVPLCPKCGQRCPHGYVSGTWLPCSCGGMGKPTFKDMLANVYKEYQQKKGGDNK